MRWISVVFCTFASGALANDFAACLDHHAGVRIFLHDYSEFVWDEHQFIVSQVNEGVASESQVEGISRGAITLNEQGMSFMREYENRLMAYCQSLRP